MFKKWLFKFNRIIIWPLIVITSLFLVTGFSVTHPKYRIIPLETALGLHAPLCIIFLIIFLVHVFVSCYFAIERWRTKPVNTIFAVQLERFSGWALFIVIFLYIISGYSMSGKLFSDISTAVHVHRSLDIVIIVFPLHVGINVYYIFRRWLRS